jgi:hypothetical protein
MAKTPRPVKLSAASPEEPETLEVQALIVTCGPFKGRICENDNDEFLFKSELNRGELKWFRENNVAWRTLSAEEADENPSPEAGVDCEIVTFGFYLQARTHHYIPRQFLKPATTRDLVIRSREISDIVFGDAFGTGADYSDEELVDLLKEENYILNELWRREKLVESATTPRNVFLCHSSADKPFVRQVCSDLANAGHIPWLDEFEIHVGDSIVQKITDGTKRTGALVLFLSKASVASAWVQREWSSTLARQLSGQGIKLLPALIEECEIPSILSDIKFADFRSSYNDGLDELLTGLQ